MPDYLLINDANDSLLISGTDKVIIPTPDTTLLTANNYSVAHTFTDYTPTASTVDTSYPVTNLDNYTQARRTFKFGSVSSAQYIDLDLGSAKTISHIVLYNCNFDAIGVCGSATSDFSVPATQFRREFVEDARVGRYKVLVEFASGFTYRYVRLRVDTTDLQDLDTLAEIGSIVVLESGNIITFSLNPSFGYTYKTTEFNKKTKTERLQLSDHLQYSGSIKFNSYDSDSDTDHFTLYTTNGSTSPVVFWENSPTTPEAGDKVYLCYLTNNSGITRGSFSQINTSYDLQEVL